ncbi:MAG: CpsD/CapB family tyrosine-protein kinase, partial [Planctomycetota bacterium]
PFIDEVPVAVEDEASEVPEDDALEKIAVVEPKSGTTGMGSRTYERVDGAPGDESSASGATPPGGTPPKPASASEDLDWYALLDEALPEADPAEGASDDASRVVIRLPETMAPTSEADAEQVRQLQAKLEARGLHGAADPLEDTSHPAKKLDSKKVRELTGGAGDDDDEDVGHGAAKEDETKDFAPGSKKKDDEDETKDNPGREGETAKKVDPDAPTAGYGAASPAGYGAASPAADDLERTAQLRAEDGTRLADSRRIARAETGRAASDRRGRGDAPPSGIVVEQFNRSDLDPGLVCARDASSPEADYFKQLYQRIFHSPNGSSPRVILVTSATKGEGKTTVAANLALVAARIPGRGALLVEADPRGGDLMRTFGLRMKAEGLLEALESGKDPSSYILQFKFGTLDVLPLGVPVSDAAELISSDRIGEIIRGLASRYPSSVVIVDGSSVLHAPDPLVLARHVDGVVLVVRADVTPREQIERARDLIGAEKVIGVVLNGAGS